MRGPKIGSCPRPNNVAGPHAGPAVLAAARSRPWHSRLRKALGANYVQAGLWRGFAIRDGNLVTGQQNFSGAETARAVIAALGE